MHITGLRNGWQNAMTDAWCGLYDAVCGKTILCFHVDRLILVTT